MVIGVLVHPHSYYAKQVLHKAEPVGGEQQCTGRFSE